MDAIAAIKNSLATAEMVGMAYLEDLGNEELMMRPHPECNHLNWQIGHLIAAENQMISQISDSMPALPDGFADKYAKETAANNDASAFASKEELMAAYKAQREGTMAILEQTTAEELDQESGVDYAPTKGALFLMQGAHWMMHCGQWVAVRRMTGKPVKI